MNNFKKMLALCAAVLGLSIAAGTPVLADDIPLGGFNDEPLSDYELRWKAELNGASTDSEKQAAIDTYRQQKQAQIEEYSRSDAEYYQREHDRQEAQEQSVSDEPPPFRPVGKELMTSAINRLTPKQKFYVVLPTLGLMGKGGPYRARIEEGTSVVGKPLPKAVEKTGTVVKELDVENFWNGQKLVQIWNCKVNPKAKSGRYKVTFTDGTEKGNIGATWSKTFVIELPGQVPAKQSIKANPKMK